MTQIEFSERYIVGNEGNIEEPETQKLWIKYGFTNILIEIVDIFTNKHYMTSDVEQYYSKTYKRNEKTEMRILKDMQKICKNTNCPIIITKNYQNTEKAINIEKMRNYKQIKKYIDTFLVIDRNSGIENHKYNDIEVYDQKRIDRENKTCI